MIAKELRDGASKQLDNFKDNCELARNYYKTKKQKFINFVCFSGALLLTTATYNLKNILNDNNKYDEVTEDTLALIVNDNESLNEDEQQIVEYVSEFVSDYHQYINNEETIDCLLNFDIEYGNKEDRPSESITGAWNSKEQIMTIYCCDGSIELQNNQAVVSHELYHLLSINPDNKYSDCLSEGITCLINYEYSNYQNSDYYYKQQLIAQALCTIVGSDTLIESYLKYDRNILKDKLLDIYHDERVVNDFFYNIDRYHKLDREMLEYINRDLNKKELKEYYALREKMNNSLNTIKKELEFYYITANKELSSEVNIYLEELVKNNDLVYDENISTSIVSIKDQNIKSNLIKKKKLVRSYM